MFPGSPHNCLSSLPGSNEYSCHYKFLLATVASCELPKKDFILFSVCSASLNSSEMTLSFAGGFPLQYFSLYGGVHNNSVPPFIFKNFSTCLFYIHFLYFPSRTLSNEAVECLSKFFPKAVQKLQ